ncbi:MAG: hypothetical protein KBD53_09425 [Candidatus Omnitrophica bacterium]|nr:hypothetical protein [Candidatus Omnitrophota bacterium]
MNKIIILLLSVFYCSPVFADTEMEALKAQLCNTNAERLDVPIEEEEYRVLAGHFGGAVMRSEPIIHVETLPVTCSVLQEVEKFFKDQDLFLDFLRKNMKAYNWDEGRLREFAKNEEFQKSRIGFNKDKTIAAFWTGGIDCPSVIFLKKNEHGNWELLDARSFNCYFGPRQ